MTAVIKDYFHFHLRAGRLAFIGDWRYFAWIGVLAVFCLLGLNAYAKQLAHGLVVTGLTDQVSWGIYIANFTFLVGVAAAAVMLVIPVYIYRRKELYDLVIFGELLAIAAILMCLAFVVVDLGRPDRFWHLLPWLGKINLPGSILSWDFIVLNGYLLLNLHICGYLLYSRYHHRAPSRWFYIPFVFIAIVWGISIHTVTAFLFVGLGGRPFWNTAILGPRFIASAFAAGPAMIILALRIIRRFTDYKIKDEALLTLRSIVQVSMLISVFLLVNEVFTEFYADTLHVASATYLYFGLEGHNQLVPWIWTSVALNLVALVLLMLPVSKSLKWLDLACIFAIVGIWIEKGMGLVVPGFVPSTIGEIVEYVPTLNESLVTIGIWAFGLLVYTVLLRIAVPILQGRFSHRGVPAQDRL